MTADQVKQALLELHECQTDFTVTFSPYMRDTKPDAPPIQAQRLSDEVNPLPTDAELSRMEADYELRTRTREAEMDRFFAEWNARFKAQFDGIDAQIGDINRILADNQSQNKRRSA